MKTDSSLYELKSLLKTRWTLDISDSLILFDLLKPEAWRVSKFTKTKSPFFKLTEIDLYLSKVLELYK